MAKGARGVRLDPQHQERTRAKIQTSQIVNRLNEFVNGVVELSPAQVTAALGLLRKTLPDLTAQELSGGVASYVARIPAPAKNVTDWKNSLSKPHTATLTADKPKPVGDSGQVH